MCHSEFFFKSLALIKKLKTLKVFVYGFLECFHEPVFLATCKASASKRILNVLTKKNRLWRVGGAFHYI